MCEYRFGDYCFNPKYLEPGILALHWKEAPCCKKEEDKTDEEFWKPVKKPAPAFLFF